MALWAGRFSKEIAEDVNAFNSSISFDCRMYRQDIKGSLAHSKMLYKQGIIDELAYKEIQQGLKEILKDIEEGKLLFDPNAEDIHMFIEAELTKKYPVSGKKLHTGRSRNDQVALDLRLYNNYARLYAHAKSSADYLCPSLDGLCRNVFKRHGSSQRY